MIKVSSLVKNTVKLDKNGIWVVEIDKDPMVQSSKKKWEEIYNFSIKKLEQDRIEFNKIKLQDHLDYIEKSYIFSAKTMYLEIGCGPAYIAEYLLKKYDCTFIGIDFNYEILLVLKKYLDKKKLKNYILIHADINEIPLKNNSVDFIYGGGVIEHFKYPEKIVKELFRILKKGGVSFNTVPACNFSWFLRLQSTIPTIPFLRDISEFIHIKLLKNSFLDKYHGYELSFTKRRLYSLHKSLGFSHVNGGAFAFHASPHRLTSNFLRKSYYIFSKIPFLSPIYYIAASK